MKEVLIDLAKQIQFQPDFTVADLMVEILAVSESVPSASTVQAGKVSPREHAAIDVLKRRAASSADPRLSALCVRVLDKLITKAEDDFFIEELHRVVCSIKGQNAYLWQLIQVLHARDLLLTESGNPEPLRSGVSAIDEHISRADAVLAHTGTCVPW